MKASKVYSIYDFDIAGNPKTDYILEFVNGEALEETLSVTSSCEVQLERTGTGKAKFVINEQSKVIEAEIKITATPVGGGEVSSTTVSNNQDGYLYLNPKKTYSLEYVITTDYVAFEPDDFGVNKYEKTKKLDSFSIPSGETKQEDISLIEYSEIVLNSNYLPESVSITGKIADSSSSKNADLAITNNNPSIKVPISPDPYTLTFDPAGDSNPYLYLIMLDNGNTIDLSTKGRKDIACSYITLEDRNWYYNVLMYTGGSDTVIIPDSVKGKDISYILAYAFWGNTNLIEITLPQNCSITFGAFSDCSNLEKVYGSISDIQFSAFENCSKLTSINVDGITLIDEKAFANCTSLDLTIPNSFVTVNDDAFSGWTDQQTIHFVGVEKPADDQVPEGWDANWQRGCEAQIYWRGETPPTI